MGGEDIAALVLVISGSRHGGVDVLASRVVDEGERGPRVYDRIVAGEREVGAVDNDQSGLDGPETLRIVDRGPLNRTILDKVLVDIPKGVAVVFRVPAACQVGCEEFFVLGNIRLDHHILDGRVYRLRADGVDGTLPSISAATENNAASPAPSYTYERKTKQAVAWTLLERWRQRPGKLDRLSLDAQPPQSDSICAHNTAGGGTIAVLDLPGFTIAGLPRPGLGGIEDLVAGLQASVLHILWQQRGPKPQVGRARVEIQSQRLSWGPNLNGTDIL